MRIQKLMWRNIIRSTNSQKVSVLHYSIDYRFTTNQFSMSNARDTTYFTIKCLQTDMASKVEVVMSLK